MMMSFEWSEKFSAVEAIMYVRGMRKWLFCRIEIARGHGNPVRKLMVPVIKNLLSRMLTHLELSTFSLSLSSLWIGF